MSASADKILTFALDRNYPNNPKSPWARFKVLVWTPDQQDGSKYIPRGNIEVRIGLDVGQEIMSKRSVTTKIVTTAHPTAFLWRDTIDFQELLMVHRVQVGYQDHDRRSASYRFSCVTNLAKHLIPVSSTGINYGDDGSSLVLAKGWTLTTNNSGDRLCGQRATGDEWSVVHMNTDIPTTGRSYIASMMVYPISKFPSFDYIHRLNVQEGWRPGEVTLYIDSLQASYIPSLMTGKDIKWNRIRVEFLSEELSMYYHNQDSFPECTPIRTIVTYNERADQYRLYIFSTATGGETIFYFYIPLRSDGSVNTSSSLIEAQGHQVISGSLNTSASITNLFDAFRIGNRAIVFYTTVTKSEERKQVNPMSATIGEDGAIQNEWKPLCDLSNPLLQDIASEGFYSNAVVPGSFCYTPES